MHFYAENLHLLVLFFYIGPLTCLMTLFMDSLKTTSIPLVPDGTDGTVSPHITVPYVPQFCDPNIISNNIYHFKYRPQPTVFFKLMPVCSALPPEISTSLPKASLNLSSQINTKSANIYKFWFTSHELCSCPERHSSSPTFPDIPEIYKFKYTSSLSPSLSHDHKSY